MQKINIKYLSCALSVALAGFSITGCGTDLESQEEKVTVEIASSESEEKYFIGESLFFLDTSKINPEEKAKYYILEYERPSLGTPVCLPDEKEARCWYLERDGYNVDGSTIKCFCDIYHTIEENPENTIYFNFSRHFHTPSSSDNAPFYLTVHSSDGNYHKETTMMYSDEASVENEEKITEYQNIFVPLQSVVNEEDRKAVYAMSEIIELTHEMNAGNYSFNTSEGEVLTK